jgi:hypothetical protein
MIAGKPQAVEVWELQLLGELSPRLSTDATGTSTKMPVFTQPNELQRE